MQSISIAQAVPPLASMVAEIGMLGPFAQEMLQQEVPVFAAEGAVAHELGGPVTRAFLESLPSSWYGQPLVVDTMMVWLQLGQSLLSRWFHHEVFPGKSERAFGAANQEREVEHIACAVGAPSVREFLVGDVPEELSRIDSSNSEELKKRDWHLRMLSDQSVLHAVPVMMGSLHHYRWGAYQRTLGATAAGFHLYLRASLGSKRPIVNGLRNVASPSFSGPWSSVAQP